MFLSGSLASRVKRAEDMDDPALPSARLEAALRGLARLNRCSLAHAPFVRTLEAWAPLSGGRPLRVLDIATGAGDVLVAIAKGAAHRGLALEIAGCDINPRSVEHARRRAAEAGVRIALHRHDALRDDMPEGYDIITCSLFLHHLEDAEAVETLRRMAHAARVGVIVSDLRRCPAGWTLALLASRALTRSGVVHADALRSVRAAFTMDEAAGLARRAGMDGFEVRPLPARKFLLAWRREG